MAVYILVDNETGVILGVNSDKKQLNASSGETIHLTGNSVLNIQDLSLHRFVNGMVVDGVDPDSAEAIHANEVIRKSIISEFKETIPSMISVVKYETEVGEMHEEAIEEAKGFLASIRNEIWLFVEVGHKSKSKPKNKVVEDGMVEAIDSANRNVHDWLDLDLSSFGIPATTIAEYLIAKVNS